MERGKCDGGAAAASGEMKRPPPEAASGSESEVDEEDECQNELAERVFGNPLLAGIIYDYALCYSDESYHRRRKDMCNFRLVSQCWKEAVSTYLKTKKEPLFVVRMTETNSLAKAPEVQKNGKILDNFINFLDSREDQDSYAGFCLKMDENVFRLENYDHFLTSLGKCGQHLVEMQLDIPENGTFPGGFPNTLQLVALQKLRVWLSDSELENVPAAEGLPNPSANAILLVQSLLHYGTLKDAQITSLWVPPELQYVNLPPSLVKLDLSGSGDNPRVLECLTRNNLPELKELTLQFWYNSQYPEEDLVFRVFENFRETLRVLKILDHGSDKRDFKIRFPVMESLTRLEFLGDQFKLSSEMPSLASLFPKVTHVKLNEIGKNVVKQFRSPIPSVTSLEFHIDILVDVPDNDSAWRNFTLELMTGINCAFPNLTDLCFPHHGMDKMAFEYLHYLFREMGQLKRLSIHVCDGNIPTDHWDSLLMRVPLEFVKALNIGNLWKDIDLNIKTGHSIKMLKELQYLRLFGEKPRGPLISDLAFIFALNGMPKLEHVKLQGKFGFQISKEIVEEWEKQGRRIECDSSRDY